MNTISPKRYRSLRVLEKYFNPSVLGAITRLRSQKNYLKRDYPSRPARARSLGYKSSKDVFLVQARIGRGGVNTYVGKKGRSPGNKVTRNSRNIALSEILKERVNKKFKPARVAAYYYLDKDGKNYYYEYILVNRTKSKKLSKSRPAKSSNIK